MKKILVILIALGMISAIPVLAADHEGMKMDSHEGMTMSTPDGMRECALQAESIQQKVKRLQGEIQKGSKKYSAEDIKKLEGKLKEANDLLDNLNKPGR
jgi:peptidoglycan hydrolase CwlO-like protein